MKPNFIIGGIMKSGTTFLYNLIRNHPEIDMPKRSMDSSFFDNDLIYKRGIDWYKTLFESLDPEKVIGQVSADCAFNPGSIARIKEHTPKVKLIFIIRHPVDRSYSLYWHQVKMGREFNSFEKAIELEEEKIKKDYYHFKMYSYLKRSRYAEQFKKIFQIFDEDQILILPFEYLIKNELKCINLVFNFLEVQNISNLSDLQFEKLSKNKAKIPRFIGLLRITAFFDRINLTRLGKFLLNRTLVEKKPPKMNLATRNKLCKELNEDVEFHKKIMRKFDPDLN